MSSFSRRNFALGALAMTGLSACANGIGSNGASTIDARVSETLRYMYLNYPQTQTLSQQASGMLVMPLVTEVGLGIGGAYGRGALQVGGTSVDYYSSSSASAGLQIGGQQYSHVLFFMTQDALLDFRRSNGWALGADVEYAFVDRGETVRAETTTTRSPVIAVVFGQAGFRVGVSLEGTKYSRIIP